jgi:hypothetical protein
MSERIDGLSRRADVLMVAATTAPSPAVDAGQVVDFDDEVECISSS